MHAASLMFVTHAAAVNNRTEDGYTVRRYVALFKNGRIYLLRNSNRVKISPRLHFIYSTGDDGTPKVSVALRIFDVSSAENINVLSYHRQKYSDVRPQLLSKTDWTYGTAQAATVNTTH
jgi:hypothetical protein